MPRLTKKLIFLKGSKTAVLEITDLCFTGCGYCLQKCRTGPKGKHVLFPKIVARLQWLKKFTDVEHIVLMGGETGLHPEFIQICDVILEMGFSLMVITSAVVPQKLWHNLDYLVELYANGLIDVKMSFHNGRNEKSFAKLFRQLSEATERRHESLKLKGLDPDKMTDLQVNQVIPIGSIRNQTQLSGFINKLLIALGFKTLSPKHPVIREAVNGYIKLGNSVVINCDNFERSSGIRVSVRIQTEVEIRISDDGIVNVLPVMVGQCPAVVSSVEDGTIKLSELQIRTDGGIVFVSTNCVDMTSPLANADIHTNSKAIFQAISGSLSQIKAHVKMHHRFKMDGCGEKVECHVCPFGQMCTPCWNTTRPWQKKK